MKTNAKTSENKPALRFAAGALAMIIAVSMLSGCQKKIDDEPDPSVTQPTTTPSTQPPKTEATTVTTLPPEPEPLEKYLEFYEQNNEFVGWISIPSLTNSRGEMYIDYPVVQADDNSKYIDTDFYGEESKSGAIYADYKVPITATSHADNITLFGHSMADGTYFRHIIDYREGVDFVKEHYLINFDTRWEENQYVVVACFLIGIYEWQDDEPLFEYFKCRNFETEEDFNYFYDNIMYRSYYLSDIDCEWGDEFITLSTCAYDFDDSRFVVVARKVRDGEDISGYADTYVKNPDRHRPSILD